jgi:hypothetical protein
MRKRSLLTSFTLMVGLALLPLTVKADEPEPGVGRISLINGDVSTMRGDSGDWVATTINAPIVQGDKIATGQRSRTEVELDHANILRLDQQAEARIADLSHSRIQVQLAQGMLNLTILKGNEADTEIDTPNVAVRPMQEGIYRIQVLSDSQSLVVVREGEANISTSQGSTVVKKNQMITIRGQDSPEYQISRAPNDDAWDDWNENRDKTIRDAQSWRYANNYYTGVHDLDSYGHWIRVPGYDWVWSPYVDAGWAPYRSGRWCWEPYWDWTWVSYEPWGWAPYHYGRWFWYNTSWCWWPGPVYAAYRPIWAPAYVSFFGFGFGGHNWSFGFGFGYNSIGWLPVGPCDHYYPWHGRGNHYNVVNVTNITNINNIRNAGGVGPLADSRQRPYYSNLQMALRDPRVEHSMTAVSTEDFTRGRMDLHNQIRNTVSLRDAQLVQGTVPVVPTRDSLRPVDRPVNTASLPARTATTGRFFGTRQSPAGPQPFNDRAAQIQRMVQTRNPVAAINRPADSAGGLNRTGLSAGSTPAAVSSGHPAPSPGSSAVTNLTSQRNQLDRSVSRSVERSVPNSGSTPGQPGWQRFGQTMSGNQQPTAIPNSSSREALRAPAASATTPNPNFATQGADRSSSWQRFSRGNTESRVSVREGTAQSGRNAPVVSDRYAVGATGAQSTGSRTLQSPAEYRGSWQRFDSRERMVPSSPGDRSFGSFPSRSESSRPALDRYSSPYAGRSVMRDDMRPSYRPEVSAPRTPSRTYESPRSYQRPPLQMSRPIVTERSAPSGGGGGRSVTRSDSRGGTSAPSSSHGSSRGHR